jgi:hypothetical protein
VPFLIASSIGRLTDGVDIGGASMFFAEPRLGRIPPR